MKLFQKLYISRKDISLENYFTQIVSYLFQCQPGLLYSWLHDLDQNQESVLEGYTSVQIEPQPRHDKSRPDIRIKLRTGSELDVILVEAKIESGEHDDQLQRYACILKNEFPHARRRILVYATKYYEPKEERAVLKDASGLVTFVQIRWHDFYHLLKKQPYDSLIQEVITFMEEHGMAHSNQFSTGDVAAMAHLMNLYSLMNTSLADDVFEKFQIIAKDRVSSQPDLDLEYGFYMLTSKFRNDSTRWLGIGFNLGNSVEVSEVAAIFQINPESRDKERFLPALKVLADEFHWVIRCWDGDPSIEEEGNWIDVTFTQKLDELIQEGDNLNQVKKFFLDRMNEIEQVQQRYPRLPWER